jgi:hypothetical protein
MPNSTPPIIWYESWMGREHWRKGRVYRYQVPYVLAYRNYQEGLLVLNYDNKYIYIFWQGFVRAITLGLFKLKLNTTPIEKGDWIVWQPSYYNPRRGTVRLIGDEEFRVLFKD